MRLALLACLRLEPGSVGVLAPVCSSMGFLTASQFLRNMMAPLGDSSRTWVESGNLLAIRYLRLNLSRTASIFLCSSTVAIHVYTLHDVLDL